MKGTFHYVNFYLIGMALLCSCASPPASFYTLSAIQEKVMAPSPSVGIAVGPVSIPETVDRPQMVLQAGPNEVTIDEMHRWAASPRDGIQRVVMENLSHLLGTSRVYRYPQGPVNSPDYRIEMEVLRFESTPGEGTFLDVVWTVRGSAKGEFKTGRTTSRQTVANKSYEALAGAHSQALEALSRDVAVAIQSLEHQAK
jgi:uncharacterized lipoprotein YmbA